MIFCKYFVRKLFAKKKSKQKRGTYVLIKRQSKNGNGRTGIKQDISKLKHKWGIQDWLAVLSLMPSLLKMKTTSLWCLERQRWRWWCTHMRAGTTRKRVSRVVLTRVTWYVTSWWSHADVRRSHYNDRLYSVNRISLNSESYRYKSYRSETDFNARVEQIVNDISTHACPSGVIRFTPTILSFHVQYRGIC